jgi:hypothetical protein
VLADRRGEDLVVRADTPRHPAAAATDALLGALLSAEI